MATTIAAIPTRIPAIKITVFILTFILILFVDTGFRMLDP
jgi:hypothetical protein